MKLYHTKGTCSFGPHIVLREIGRDFDLVPVNLMEKTLADGSDFRAINPKGYVPFIETDDGKGLSECAAIVQYLADRNPECGLAPAAGTAERYQLQEWLSFIGSELHKNIPPLFLPYIPEDYRPVARKRVAQRLDYMDAAIAGKDYLMGSDFTVADAYAFAVLNWTGKANYDLAAHPNVKSWFDRVAARPSVKAAFAAEG